MFRALISSPLRRFLAKPKLLHFFFATWKTKQVTSSLVSSNLKPCLPPHNVLSLRALRYARLLGATWLSLAERMFTLAITTTCISVFHRNVRMLSQQYRSVACM